MVQLKDIRDKERRAQRFWARVQMCQHGRQCAVCCWPWSRSLDKRGYGQVTVQLHTKPALMRAHRLAWMFTHGDIPEGLFVCHNCPGGDKPRCCNPAHLWVGTCWDNTHDAMDKGWLPSGDRNSMRLHPERVARGERHSSRTRPDVPSNRAVLVLSQVQDIIYLAAHGMPDGLLAHIYNVSRHAISMIRRGKTWQRVLANAEGARQ